MVLLVWLFYLPCLPLSLLVFSTGGSEVCFLLSRLQMCESCLALLKIAKMEKTNILEYFFQFKL